MHFPVLLKEVGEYLLPEHLVHQSDSLSDKFFIDATIGEGGHSLALLKKNNYQGKILGIEADPKSALKLKEKIKDLGLEKNFIIINDNFVNLKKIIKENRFFSVDGILFDLGLSSGLIEESGRGFSFMRQEVLDMRFNPYHKNLTAAHILNQYSEEELKNIFKIYGGERFSGRIAREILAERKKEKIILTNQLVRIIKQALGFRYHIKSSARVFQALRIEVNDELENLKKVLADSLEILPEGVKIAVISYHSGEDRIVKRFFKDESKIKELTKKPISPSEQEIKKNKRARSAKLRVGEKIS